MLGVTDLFFKRQKKLRGEYSDVYQYEELPNQLRVQLVHLWRDSIGEDFSGNSWNPSSQNRVYLKTVYNILCKELGVLKLSDSDTEYELYKIYFIEISNFFLSSQDIEVALSVVELMTKIVGIFIDEDIGNKLDFSEIINETNQRFKEHGVGYQFENGQIIKVDEQFIHSETVKPALQLLNKSMYKGAQEEFLKAHEHYRNQRYHETLNECLKAYESTLKAILDKRNWEYSKKATADELTGRCLQNGLVPDYWSQYFKSLKNTLTAGLPTARNNLSGHGQGNETKEIPEYLVSYILHMTASIIVFLTKAEESLDNS